MNGAARYPSNRPVLLDDDGLPVPCRACASKVAGVAQLATHIADGDACCDACDPEWVESQAAAPTEPAPPMGDQDDAAHRIAHLQSSLDLVADARAAGVPTWDAFRIAGKALRRAGSR